MVEKEDAINNSGIQNEINTEKTENNTMIDEKSVVQSKHSDVSESASGSSEKHHIHRHHHHSSKQRSKHKSRSKKSFKEKLKKIFSKKHAKILNIVAISLVLVVAFAILSIQNINFRKKIDALTELNQQYKNSQTVVNSDSENLSIEIPVFEKDVVLVNDITLQVLKMNPETDVLSYLSSYRSELGRMDEGLSVVIDLDLLKGANWDNKYICRVEISSNSVVFKTRVFNVTEDAKILEIHHLETGKTYECKIVLSTGESLTTTFETADTPRILRIDGLVNVRDIGGWQTTDGKRIKQGMLYRGSEIDGAVQPSYKITSDGRDDMLMTLGVKYDLDLRASTDHTEEMYPFGANVTHKYYDAPMYDSIFDEKGKSTLGSIFKDIANPSNYPMYLHCTYGVDRTGTVCYLLESLLGVPEESLLKDYQLSGLFHEWLNIDGIVALNEYLVLNYPGDTLREKSENYLLDCGVTAEEISTIRSIFLVDENNYNS